MCISSARIVSFVAAADFVLMVACIENGKGVTIGDCNHAFNEPDYFCNFEFPESKGEHAPSADTISCQPEL